MNIFRRAWTKFLDVFFPNKHEKIADYLPEAPPKPPNYPEGFSTDGCSGGMSLFWRKVLRRVPPWEGCCIAHDLEYWRGGFWMDRKNADLALAHCIREQGHPIWAFLMYYAVRIGGAPFFPVPWRWGYGWEYTARYQKPELSRKLIAPETQGSDQT